MQRQKKLTRKKSKKLLKIKIVAIIIVILVICIGIVAVYLSFFVEKPLFVSPIASDQRTERTRIEEALKREKINYVSISAQKDHSYLIKASEGGEIIFSSKKDILKQISSLQLILKRLKIEGKTFRRLDFRYERVVIAF